MILVDRRAGSHELMVPLQAMGLSVEETTLDFGDLLFQGKRSDGGLVTIAIEHKKMGDLVNSFRTGRLPGHQAIGLQAFDYRYLLIEGELLYDKQGKLLRRQGRLYSYAPLKDDKTRRTFIPMPGGMTIGELLKRVYREHVEVGLTPIFSRNRRDTLRLIEALYHVWTDAGHSHIAVYTPPTLVPLSQFRKTVMTLPGIGVRTSAAVEQYFEGSLREAFASFQHEWAGISITDEKGKARRLGDKDAAKIVAVLDRCE